MSAVRDKFESRPDIAIRLDKCRYDGFMDTYIAKSHHDYATAAYLCGSWRAWQEQQVQVDFFSNNSKTLVLRVSEMLESDEKYTAEQFCKDIMEIFHEDS